MSINRRDFLRAGIALSASTLLPTKALFAESPLVSKTDPILILIELAGGNDGLNTVAPVNNPAYQDLRPTLALNADECLALDGSLMLHGACSHMHDLYSSGALAVLPGVGMPTPNRSHFTGIKLWNSARDGSERPAQSGWIARSLSADYPAKQSRLCDGISLGKRMGPLSGPHIRTLGIKNVDHFVGQAEVLDGAMAPVAPDDPIEALKQDIRKTSKELENMRATLPPLGTAFPDSKLGQQAKVAAELCAMGRTPAALVLSLRGFDTHKEQAETQKELLTQLDESLYALSQSLKATGDWDRTLILTYSEFGRRVKENGSKGTDHGGASAHFITGGRVKGGIHGTHPSLTDLRKGDLKFTRDFRSIFRGIADVWWGVDPNLVTDQVDDNFLPIS